MVEKFDSFFNELSAFPYQYFGYQITDWLWFDVVTDQLKVIFIGIENEFEELRLTKKLPAPVF